MNYSETMKKFESLNKYHTVGYSDYVVLYCDDKPLKDFKNTLKAMEAAIIHSQLEPASLELGNIYYYCCNGDTLLETYDNLTTKQAEKALHKLFSWWGNVTKPDGEKVCKWDVYPNAKKMIDQGSLTLKQVQNIAEKHFVSSGVVEMRINDLKKMN